MSEILYLIELKVINRDIFKTVGNDISFCLSITNYFSAK